MLLYFLLYMLYINIYTVYVCSNMCRNIFTWVTFCIADESTYFYLCLSICCSSALVNIWNKLRSMQSTKYFTSYEINWKNMSYICHHHIVVTISIKIYTKIIKLTWNEIYRFFFAHFFFLFNFLIDSLIYRLVFISVWMFNCKTSAEFLSNV